MTAIGEPRRLHRSRADRKIAGVLGGIASGFRTLLGGEVTVAATKMKEPKAA